MSTSCSEARRNLLEKSLRGAVLCASRRFRNSTPRPVRARSPSYSQEQVWLHAQLVPDIPLYNEPVTIHYSGDLNVPALEASFNEILRRHEAWRTCFTVIDGEPRQDVKPDSLISLPSSIFGNFLKTSASQPLRASRRLEAVTPLDLTQAPLFRARLIRLEDQQYRLYLVLEPHHF